MSIINLKLSTGSIDNLLDTLKKVDEKVQYALTEAVGKTTNEAVDIIMANSPVDTGETRDSTDYTMTENQVVITQKGDHVFENEFGDGIYFAEMRDGGKYPEEKIAAGMPTHTGRYKYTPTNPNSKYYQKVETYNWKYGYWEIGAKQMRAVGQFASAQMYAGSLHLRENLPKNVKQKVSDALSKI